MLKFDPKFLVANGGDISCSNGAVLSETGDDSDTYGVFESHTVRGATVTKKNDGMDIAGGTIRWQTTIDDGITVDNGSVYRDYIWRERMDEPNGSTIYPTAAPDKKEITAEEMEAASELYTIDGAIRKLAEDIGDDDPEIAWHIYVNDKKYDVNELLVTDRIPDDLEFDLSMLEPRWIVDDTNTISVDDFKKNEGEQYYHAEYREEIRELTIHIKQANKKVFEFNIKTMPTLDVLKRVQNGQSFDDPASHKGSQIISSDGRNYVRYDNMASVWSVGENSRKLAQKSARADVSYRF